MKNVTLIAAIGKNRELGKNNNLIWHLPEDLKFFKDNTIGKPIVMGSNTLKSLPKKLKDRQYVILTSKDIENPDYIVVHSIEELLHFIESEDREVMIIGGASIYRQMLPFADRMLLTEVDAEDKEADVYFPEFKKEEWKRVILSKYQTEDNISYEHLEYKRKRD